MSERIRTHQEEQPNYLPIDTAVRNEHEITQLLEKHINRDDISRHKQVEVDDNGEEEIVIHHRTQEERTAYIVQSTLIALEITPSTPDLFATTDGWQLDPTQRANAQHAHDVEESVRAARKILADAQARLSKVEFGDFMLDVLDDVQKHKAHTDLYRAFRILQSMSIDRDDLVPAHRVGLVMLHQTI